MSAGTIDRAELGFNPDGPFAYYCAECDEYVHRGLVTEHVGPVVNDDDARLANTHLAEISRVDVSDDGGGGWSW